MNCIQRRGGRSAGNRLPDHPDLQDTRGREQHSYPHTSARGVLREPIGCTRWLEPLLFVKIVEIFLDLGDAHLLGINNAEAFLADG